MLHLSKIEEEGTFIFKRRSSPFKKNTLQEKKKCILNFSCRSLESIAPMIIKDAMSDFCRQALQLFCPYLHTDCLFKAAGLVNELRECSSVPLAFIQNYKETE